MIQLEMRSRWLRATMCVLAGCAIAVAQSATAQTVRDTNLRVREVVSGLNGPTNMAFIGNNDILVLQKGDGRVRRVINGVLQAGAVLDVAVDSSSERGLLGIALHPSFPSTPSVYLYYTESGNGSDTSGGVTPVGNRVYRYTWNGSALIDASSPLISLPVTPGPNHDGGVITFGPDGKLYVVIGDLNRGGQLQNNAGGAAPDDTGVILRLNADGSIPADNPFSSQGGALAKYYAYGVRNSFGLAFDPVTGRLWDTENGPSSYDEVNLVLPGFNSGWHRIMGPVGRDAGGTSDLVVVPGSAYRDPAFSWFTPVGVTAIRFLNSSALGAQYQNDIFVGDINNGNLYRFEPNSARNGLTFTAGGLTDLVADNVTERDATIFGSSFGGITDLRVGPDGLLYVLSFSGRIFAISPATTSTTTVSVTPTTVAAGNNVTVSWNGIAAPSGFNWIGLYNSPTTGSWNHGGTLRYVNCTQTPGSAAVPSGSCPFPIPGGLAAGSYEIRLHQGQSWNAIARTALTITSGGSGSATTISVTPTSFSAGSTVTVSWTGIAQPSQYNWMGLYNSPTAPSWHHGGTLMYVNCTQTPGSVSVPSGSCAFRIPAGLASGTYQMRLHRGQSWIPIATSTPLTIP